MDNSNIGDQRYTGDNLGKIEPYLGYDYFVGKAKDDKGRIGFIIYNLMNSGGIEFFRLEEQITCLFDYYIKKNKKILFAAAPPRKEPYSETYGDITKHIDMITKLCQEKGCELTVYEGIDPAINKDKIVNNPGINFVCLSNDEMMYFKKMYEQRNDLKEFPNPFEYQPSIN